MSKVPKDMGKRVQQELQRALDEWRNNVFEQGVVGYNKDKRTQKIEVEQ